MRLDIEIPGKSKVGNLIEGTNLNYTCIYGFGPFSFCKSETHPGCLSRKLMEQQFSATVISVSNGRVTLFPPALELNTNPLSLSLLSNVSVWLVLSQLGKFSERV